MKTDDVFQFIAKELLRFPEEKMVGLLENLKSSFQDVEWNKPRQPKMFSLAGDLASGETVGFETWIIELKRAGAVAAQNFKPLEGQPGLPAHKAAAFANGNATFIAARLKDKCLLYQAAIIYSREVQLTGSELEELIDLQFSDPRVRAELWQEILEKEVKRFGDYFEASTEKEARHFVRESFQATGSKSAADDVLKCAQLFCAARGCTFKIPGNLVTHFMKVDFDEVERDFFIRENPDRANEFVPASESLRFLKSLTPQEFVSLVDHQELGEGIWIRIKDRLAWLIESNESLKSKLPLTGGGLEFRSAMLTLSADELSELPRGNLASTLQEYVRGQGREVAFPTDLQEHLSLGWETEKPLIKDKDLWRAAPNTETWQMLRFLFVGEVGVDQVPPSLSLAEQSKNFEAALLKTESFAKRVTSPFAEAFQLAKWLLTESALSPVLSSTGDFEQAVTIAEKSGFSQQALRVLSQQTFLAGLCAKLELDEPRTRALLATSVGDVFGGMGSWNDQGFETEADQREFEAVSAELYSALTRLLSAL